jgi:hypothetical protein
MMPESPQPDWPPETHQLLARYWEVSNRIAILNSRRMSAQLTRIMQGINGEVEETEAMRRWWMNRY